MTTFMDAMEDVVRKLNEVPDFLGLPVRPTEESLQALARAGLDPEPWTWWQRVIVGVLATVCAVLFALIVALEGRAQAGGGEPGHPSVSAAHIGRDDG